LQQGGARTSGRPEGSATTAEFDLDGQAFTALNGGPVFSPARRCRWSCNCQTQDEVDHYCQHLPAGADENAQQCGWLKDRYGPSWQVIPRQLIELLTDPDQDKARRSPPLLRLDR